MERLSRPARRPLGPGLFAQTPPVTLAGIPGIVAAGTPVILVKGGYNSSEGPMAAPDGSLYFSEPSDNKIYHVDANDNITVLFDAKKVDDEKGERWRLPALAMDKRGRIFACRRAGPGKIGIAIVYPESEARFVAQSYKGKSFVAPNDLAMGQNGAIYFTDPAPERIARTPFIWSALRARFSWPRTIWRSRTEFSSAATKKRFTWWTPPRNTSLLSP